MSTEEYISESSASSHQASDGLEAELAQMDATSAAPEANTGRGQ
jgi:hypothetical protein